MKRRAHRPILITDAAPSHDDQLRRRQVRYVLMMSIRAACLVVGAVLVGADAPLLWLWLPLCLLGMVVIPWLAVILANDRAPKDRHRLANRPHRDRAEEVPPQALPSDPAPHRTIDADQ